MVKIMRSTFTWHLHDKLSEISIVQLFDESTNIAANLHCLWLIFRQASREDNFTMHSGKFLWLRI